MKKTFLSLFLIFLVTILFSACKKDKNEPDSSSYISFKMDNSQKIMKVKATAVLVSQENFNSIAFTAYHDTTSAEVIYIQISEKGKQITANSYTATGPGSEDLLVIAGYMPASQDPAKIYSAGLQRDSNGRLNVTITTLTSTNVSGTFSGTFYDNNGEGPGTATVTEGKFNLPLYSNP